MTHPYATADYARSLTHIGDAFAVPEWGGHVLTRSTPHGGREDAIGPYPLTVIAPESDVQLGLERMAAAGFVSVVLVLDDHHRPDLSALEQAFDFVRPFKAHHVHDRSLGPPAYGKHHRYELRRALGKVEAAEIALADHLEAWQDLYGQLAARHSVSGPHAFPAAHHQMLATLPGVRTFGAFADGRLVSAHIFVTHEGQAFSHLAASSADGYATGAAYAVNDAALQTLTDCQVINFGGGAGFRDDPADGLVRFKKGFSNRAAQSYLCGKVLDRAAYDALSAGFGEGGFFPAYRGTRNADQG